MTDTPTPNAPTGVRKTVSFVVTRVPDFDAYDCFLTCYDLKAREQWVLHPDGEWRRFEEGTEIPAFQRFWAASFIFEDKYFQGRIKGLVANAMEVLPERVVVGSNFAEAMVEVEQ